MYTFQKLQSIVHAILVCTNKGTLIECRFLIVQTVTSDNVSGGVQSSTKI